MKFIPILILTIFLQGCSILEKRPEPPAIITNTVNLDSSVLELCPKLTETIDFKKFPDVTALHGELATQYANCANKQYDSVQLLKKFGNIK